MILKMLATFYFPQTKTALFNVDGKQLVRVNIPHNTTVSADMTSKGIFVVHAVSSGGVVHKRTLLFEGGVVDCFIFFQ